MRTIQMTIDEGLLSEVDRVVQQLGTTRSAFIRNALLLALQQQKVLLLDLFSKRGYYYAYHFKYPGYPFGSRPWPGRWNAVHLCGKL